MQSTLSDARLESSQDPATDPRAPSRTDSLLPVRRVRLFPASARSMAINYCAAATLLVGGYVFYATNPFYRTYFSPVGFTALRYLLIAYLLLLPLYYATLPDSYCVKCRLCWRALLQLGRRWPTLEEKTALRAVIVKAFYLPLMVNWLLLHLAGLAENCQAFLNSGQYFPDGYMATFRLILFVDVFVFTVGYGIEHPWLRNEIRSVEPTLLGWMAALVCYPPLFFATHRALGWYTEDLPVFASAWLQWTVAVLMLILLSIYCSASVALGLKGSNLTHRGVVSRGPYAWVRHPAYAAKNISWWVGALPWFIAHLAAPRIFVAGVVGLAGWNAIYYLRAVTEERHLGQDPDYQDYRRKVPYRFLPGLF